MLIIDRLEGIFAICEQDDGRHVFLSAGKVSAGSQREGGCYRITGDAFLLDEAETERRRKENAALFSENAMIVKKLL